MKNREFTIIDKINESVTEIRKRTQTTPLIGIILGTGLGKLAYEIEVEVSIPYFEIPHFPNPTVEAHDGFLIFGKLGGKDVVAMQGRFHYYEGYSMEQITFPIRVLKHLGIKALLISNACGSMNPYFRKGELMLIDDHINMIGDSPLRGKHYDSLGLRFVDMSRPWSRRLMDIAEKIASEEGIKLNKGVYVALAGPNLETRAEYRMLRMLGADVVGMSTVPENIAARQMGLRVLGMSIITDECYPDALAPVSLEEIIEAASIAEPKLTKIFDRLVNKIDISIL